MASSKLLKDRGIKQVVLVTDAASLLRAERCFQRQGVEVISSGCRYRALNGFPFSLTSFVPSIEAAEDLSEAWHEGLGLVWYWFRIGFETCGREDGEVGKPLLPRCPGALTPHTQ